MKKNTIFCFFGLSKVFNLKLLKKYLVFIVEKNFVAFSKAPGFKKADYKTIQTFVSSSTIHVSSETEVFEAIVRWIKHDENYRKYFMCDLLQSVRLPLLSCEIIEHIITNNKFCKSCQKCCDYIENIIAVKKNQHASFFDNLQNRCCIDSLTHFKFSSHVASIGSSYGFANLDQKQDSLNIEEYKFCYLKDRPSVDLYSCETGSFKLCNSGIEPQKSPFKVCNFAVCMFMNKLYMLGGRSLFNLSDCTMYDPETKQLTRMESMQNERNRHSCVVFAGKIVVTHVLRWF